MQPGMFLLLKDPGSLRQALLCVCIMLQAPSSLHYVHCAFSLIQGIIPCYSDFNLRLLDWYHEVMLSCRWGEQLYSPPTLFPVPPWLSLNHNSFSNTKPYCLKSSLIPLSNHMLTLYLFIPAPQQKLNTVFYSENIIILH